MLIPLMAAAVGAIAIALRPGESREPRIESVRATARRAPLTP